MILASASPRRRELLLRAGFSFEVEPADIDEIVPEGVEPRFIAGELARQKALHIAQQHRGENSLVLGADTIVAVEVSGRIRILGKPKDEAEAEQFLCWLSDSRHQVITGVSVIDIDREVSLVEAERTFVTMRRIEPLEVSAYVGSGEWRGKAGGYAIQENADAFVTRLEEGGFDNVVGLPVELTTRMLAECGFTHTKAS